jgi:hypothetical protein
MKKYLRIAIGGIGHPGDIERLRIMATELASTEGFTSRICRKDDWLCGSESGLFRCPGAAAPELMKIATGKEPRPPELGTFAAAFAVASEKQEIVADQETLAFLKRFSRNPGIAKATVDFELAQRVEQRFHKEFDGIDLTGQ